MAIERFEFDEEIAVEPVEGRAEAYAGSFGEGWRIGNGVNGGVIMSLATKGVVPADPPTVRWPARSAAPARAPRGRSPGPYGDPRTARRLGGSHVSPVASAV